MDPDPKTEYAKESDISRFSLDGVVAEMVIEVDEEEAISPIKTLKLNGLEKYNARKESALCESSVVLDSKINMDEASKIEKETETNFLEFEEPGKDLQECSSNLEFNVPKYDKSKKDDHVVEDPSEDKTCEDVVQDREISKTQSEVLEKSEISESNKCDLSKENQSIASEQKEPEETENQEAVPDTQESVPDTQESVPETRESVPETQESLPETQESVPETQQSETTDENQVELSKTKQSKSLGKRKFRAFRNKESKDSREREFDAELKEESPVEKENLRKSSNRTISKDVIVRETRSSVNQLKKRGRFSQLSKSSALPENKKNSIVGKLQTNAAKSVLSKAKLTAQNKSGKIVTPPLTLKGGTKRKLRDQEPKPEVAVKKLKQTPKVKSQLKSSKSTPSLSEIAISRRHSLRKPHFLISPTAKPKAFNLYPKSDSRLNTFVEVREQLNITDFKYLRALYRLMYDRWPPKDLEELKKEILQFQGFTFNKKSDELEKRQHVLKKLPDASVLNLCKILDLKEGTKQNMISDIIKFLLKPVKVIYSVVNPFQPSMQPVVKLERISLDDKTLQLVKDLDHKSKREIKTSKRKRFPSSRLTEYVSGVDSLTEAKGSDSGKAVTSSKSEPQQIEKRKPGRPCKRKGNKMLSKSANSVDEGSKEIEVECFKKGTTKVDKTGSKSSEEQSKQRMVSILQNNMTTRQKRKGIQPENKSQEIMKLAAKIQSSKSVLKSIQKDESVTLNTSALDIKEEVIDEPDVPMKEKIPDSSCDITLSSDETREEQVKQNSLKKKKVMHKRSGKPLRCFNYIKDSILNGNFNALRRLHILLFGASDKIENIKTNILSFGGFPFLEGSEEWKQKEFLLSLLAQNTLKEYLNLLCIDHGDDDNHTLINKLMRFLAVPKDKVLEGAITQVVSSEPISHAPIQIKTQNKKNVLKKNIDIKPVVLPGRRSTKYRKVLMDEEQVRRLESDFAREQRILEREKRQVEKLKLMSELNAERTGARSSVKFCQAINCDNNSRVNKDISYFNFPSEPVRLEKWLSNVKLKPTNRKYANSYLCSKHFDVRAFTNTCKNARLLRCAVPTIPAPGSTWSVKYPCLDGYSAPGSSRLKHAPSPTKQDEPANTSLTMSIDVDTIPDYEPGKNKSGKSCDSKKQAPLQKLIGDMTKKRASLMAQETDSELLDALLQTVYKRRALKSAGAVISIPNKGIHTRLGELDNVKFLVVTANYNDLDVLHHLIYMTEATKTRVRKNILDFAGFNFAEDSTPYKDRMEFLKGLGYDISKRIGFLLGLCPYKMDIPQQDLNELIMYFLMSPCKSKQVPIRHLPQNFFTKDMPKELCLLLQKHGESVSPDKSEDLPPSQTKPPEKNIPVSTDTSEDDLPPKIMYHQKAKKSFKSSQSPIKRNSLSPTLPVGVRKPPTLSPRGRPPGKRPFQLPNILAKPPPPPTITTSIRPPPLQKSILKTPVMVSNFAKAAPQEFLIQQQTPDGQQKTYKLIKLPSSHPLNSAIKTPAVQSQLLPQLQSNTPIAGPPLPPGIIIFKNNNPVIGNSLQTVVNPVPQIQFSTVLPTVSNSELTVTRVVTDSSPSKVPVAENVPLQFDYNEKVEELHPLEDNDPTDEELYSSIQEIIHNSNFEDITLRNVIDRVSAQYAAFDLTNRHAFMKECVKKIIIGT